MGVIVDIAMQGFGDIVPIEHALLMADQRQNLFRFLPDQFRILACCLVIQPAALDRQSLLLHLRGMHAHVLGRRQLKTALHVRAMIDANIQAFALKLTVGNAFPCLPDIAKLHVGCRHTICQQPCVLMLEISLLAKAGYANLSRRHQHMRMVVPDITMLAWRMDCKIHGRAIAVCQILGEGACSLQPPLCRKLMRKRDFEFAGDAGIPALFCKLGSIPQGRTIQSPIGRKTVRQHDLFMLHSFFPGKIMHEAIAMIGKKYRTTVGGRCHSAAAG